MEHAAWLKALNAAPTATLVRQLTVAEARRAHDEAHSAALDMVRSLGLFRV